MQAGHAPQHETITLRKARMAATNDLAQRMSLRTGPRLIVHNRIRIPTIPIGVPLPAQAAGTREHSSERNVNGHAALVLGNNAGCPSCHCCIVFRAHFAASARVAGGFAYRFRCIGSRRRGFCLHIPLHTFASRRVPWLTMQRREPFAMRRRHRWSTGNTRTPTT